MFAHQLWKIYDCIKNGLPSTDNSVEAYNANWNMSCTRKPNLWQTITGFQREDAMSAQKAFETELGYHQVNIQSAIHKENKR